MHARLSMKQSVRQHFDQLSSVYERRKRRFYLRMLRESIETAQGSRIVDLGCGTGQALSWLSGARVGVDFSEALLKGRHQGPDYVLADVEAVPFRDNSFDLVLCLDVIEHLPSLRVIDEAHRILVKNGILHLSTTNEKYGFILEVLEKIRLKLPEGPHTWRRHNEVVEKMINAGFSCSQWSKPPLSFYRGVKKHEPD